MTKKNWVDLLIDNLAGGDCPRELKGVYNSAIITKHLENAFETLFNSNRSRKEDLEDEIGLHNWKYDSLTKPYLMSVEFDSVRDKYFSNLPAAITSINNNAGIRMIYPVQSEESAFIPRSETDNFLMGGLDVSDFSDMVKYTVENNQKVYYTGGKDLLCAIKKRNENVMAKLAVKFSELEDSDEITIPDGENELIFQSVWNVMLRKKPEDLANDTTPQQPQT